MPSIDALAIDDSRGLYATQFRLPDPAAILITILFWLAHFAINTAQVLLSPPDDFMVPRAISSVVGALISLAMLVALDLLRGRGLFVRAGAALVLAFIGTAMLAAANYPIFDPFFPGGLGSFSSAFVFHFLTRFWTFAAVSAAYLALSYVLDIRERENRILALQTLAHQAQLRALRNQLNPHFLFNALNSITGLITAKRVAEAEGMTENLADFLRLSLMQDPQELIPLEEELRLQRLYLLIEEVRFPGRLKVVVDVDPGVTDALVPSLVTQPLIENSVKHAVARSTEPVEIRISAGMDGARLRLVVSDSGGNAEPGPTKSSHVGLLNVAERVHAHFGEEGAFTTEPQAEGGFRNTVVMPLKFRQ